MLSWFLEGGFGNGSPWHRGKSEGCEGLNGSSDDRPVARRASGAWEGR